MTISYARGTRAAVALALVPSDVGAFVYRFTFAGTLSRAKPV